MEVWSWLAALAVLATAAVGSETDVILYKCCPKGETLGTTSVRPCVPSSHRLLHPFHPPQIYKRPRVPAQNATYTLAYGVPMNCRLLYYLEPQREPTEVFWLLETGTVVRAGDGPLTRGNYCLEVIPQLNAVLPVLCFPEGEEEGVGVYAVYPVGMLVSIPFLATTFLVYLFIKELHNLHGRCLMCHVSCLLLGYLCLATIQVDTTAIPYYMCIVMGYAIQFFFLGTFFWLNVMCFDIYWAFSGIRKPTGSVKERDRKKLILYSIYAWGIPLLILLVTIAIDFSPGVPDTSIFKPKVGVEKCFFREYYATLIYFYMPMGIIIISNIILFSITAYRISSLRKETAVLKKDGSRKHDHNSNDKERFSLYFKLFLVMGINWVMELISALVGGPNIIWYVPDITNTLQGVFIFIIFVWKRRVRRLIWAKLNAMCGKELPNGGAKGQWSGSTRNTGSVTTTSGYSQNSVKKTPSNAIAMTPQVPDS